MIKKFLKRIFQSADKKFFTYLWQRNEIEKKAGKTQAFSIENLDLMAETVSTFNRKPYGVSYSMGLTDKPMTKHAADKDIVAIPCLWCDIDIKSNEHAAENLFPNVDAVFAMLSELKKFELYPNIIVNSGHGIHIYWILDQCILTQSDSDCKFAQNILIKIQSIIRHLSNGFTIDKTDNLGRTLRIPESFNYKGNPENIPKSEIIFDDDNTFNNVNLFEKINSTFDSFIPKSKLSKIGERALNAVEKIRNSNPVYDNRIKEVEFIGDSQLLIQHCEFFKYIFSHFNSINYHTLLYAIPILLTDVENGERISINLCKAKFGDNYKEYETIKRIKEFKTKLKPTTCKKLRELYPNLDCSACPVRLNAKNSPCALIQSQIVREIVESTPNSIGEIFPDAPQEIKHLIFPRGYKFNQNGLITLDGAKILMVYPVIIYRRVREFDENQTKYEITYQTDRGNWLYKELAMKNLVNSKYVTDTLADLGIPTNSNVAKPNVDFFSDFLAINKGKIEDFIYYPRIGWNKDRFLIPANLTENERIKHGNFLQSLEPCGELEAEKALIMEGLKYAAVRLLIAANLAAPMLRLINYRNFIVNIWGATATGKTAALTLANSMIGSPDYIVKLNTTANAFEMILSERNDSPINSNEFQLIASDAKTREKFANGIIYKQESGTTKARLNKNAESKPIQSWKSILIITAEESITRDNSFGGEKTRTLEFSFFPFIGTVDKNLNAVIDEELISKIYNQTIENYGHIFPIFVNQLIKIDRKKLNKTWEDTTKDIIIESQHTIQIDHAKMLSLLMLAYTYFLKWIIGFSEEESRTITRDEFLPLIKQIPHIEESTDSNRAKAFIIDWYNVHERYFVKPNTEEEKKPKDIYGYLDQNDVPMIIPSVLKKALRDAGFSPNKILSEWERGDLITYDEKNKQYSRLYRCPDGKIRRLTILEFLPQEEENKPTKPKEPTPVPPEQFPF